MAQSSAPALVCLLRARIAGGSSRRLFVDCRRHSAALGLGLRRHVSTGRRDFYQNLNEQYLAKELSEIANAGNVDPAEAKKTVFDPKIRLRPTRRPSPIDPEQWERDFGDRSSSPSSSSRAPVSDVGFGEFKSQRSQPWQGYESLRGADLHYDDEKRKGVKKDRPKPRWQDLTHSEAQRLQEMAMRKRMMDRKLLWLKSQELPNPQKEAKMLLRERKNKQQEAANRIAATSEATGGEGLQMYPLITPYVADESQLERKMSDMVDRTMQEELESRFRNRIRQEKLQNARIVKASVPAVNGVTLDPIKRHVHRRLLRQRTKIYKGLEEALTKNSAQMLHEHLGGAAISIVRVSARRPRQTQWIHYALSTDHDPDWVQRKLDIAAPKLRSALALSENMGQTPNIQFVPHAPAVEGRKDRLWRMARALRARVPPGGSQNPNIPTPTENYIPGKKRELRNKGGSVGSVTM
eukprot:TRINITY_DN10022_c0_g2_i1.p1 TRINITY_DN10022_c0_g2~~TRINITY_DN10022_c0_g2_i1.p1  ORF type:complete len:496 (-),score=105.18 TRINITY_DN10022_c0_g2_i1:16-1410(-)